MTTKKDIVREIAQKTGLRQVQVHDVVQGTFDAIINALQCNDRIELRNFGVFEVRFRAERKARNPRTGEEVIAPAKRTVVFKPGKLMQDKVR